MNFSGICCTMTMPGEFAGNCSSMTRSASVPPVDAPTQTTISVVFAMARPLGGGSTASAVNFAVVPPVATVARRDPPSRACAARRRGI